MLLVDEEITSCFIESPIMDTVQVKLNHWIWIDRRRATRSELGIGKRVTKKGAEFVRALPHISTPRAAATVKMSLSPRPHRLHRMI